MHGIFGLMQIAAQIGFFILGFVQLFATASYFTEILRWGDVLGWLLALLLSWFPLVGSVLGMLGAHDVWGWGWLPAFFLFFWPLPILAASFVMDMRQRQRERQASVIHRSS